jgi:MFS family permease
MLFFGLGIGLCWAAAPPLIVAASPTMEAGSMLAFNQILRPLGGAIGTALAGWVLSTHSDASGWPGAGAFDAVFGMSLACCVAVLLALTVSHPARPEP